AFQITASPTWLTATPASGQLQGSQNIQLTANSAGLLVGANHATLTIAGNGTSQNIPVTLNVGTGGGLTLSPNPMNFQYVTSTASFTSGQTQFLTISGASAGATVNATAFSSPAWLLLGTGGGTTATAFPVSSQLPISVNPAVL